ncbi:UDP-Glycosyltransferase superfamily protein [Perilla frutescens var. hirtella]|uniref:UDP-Glycosyltransferase superfamily protein n=1 Tax=Perilla frutescens var. hirtella TaxID=608512 RepID=A0AAD4JGG0_PERFH|nr:UDP-Glycosyltransferase superfamily protein [Perilla frutescens var. hirtella]
MAGASSNCHIVAMPYPGRGHINPMLNLCRLILHSRPEITVSFIVTEEFHTVPNVIPSEIGRGKDFPAFYKATITKLEAPVEQLLDRLPPPKPTVIIYDTYLIWPVAVGNRRSIPVASFYTMSATVFSIFHHHHLLPSNIADEEGEVKLVDYIPGVPPMRITDLPTPIYGKGHEVLPQALQAIHSLPKAQYLLFTSVYELESQVIDALRQTIPLKIYSLGLAIPSFNVESSCLSSYLKWLDAQPHDSVLYISQGSFLSVSNAQLEEIIIGVRASGVRFLWVGRGEGGAHFEEKCGGRGLVVPWCDQLRVLSHPSVGGFWSHCGWNSTKEGAFAGLPMLTFPIFWDQVTNSKMIVEDWKFGLRVKEDESLVRGDEIAELVVRLMDSERPEAMERRRRAKEMQEICKNAGDVGGSSHADVMAFIRDISGC